MCLQSIQRLFSCKINNNKLFIYVFYRLFNKKAILHRRYTYVFNLFHEKIHKSIIKKIKNLNPKEFYTYVLECD